MFSTLKKNREKRALNQQHNDKQWKSALKSQKSYLINRIQYIIRIEKYKRQILSNKKD